jgi:hypothetical protein
MDKLLWNWFYEKVHTGYGKMVEPSVEAGYFEKMEENQNKILST